jgi:hypothetical protein
MLKCVEGKTEGEKEIIFASLSSKAFELILTSKYKEVNPLPGLPI